MGGAGVLLAGYVVPLILVGVAIELWRQPAAPRSSGIVSVKRTMWAVLGGSLLIVATGVAAALTGFSWLGSLAR